MDEQNQIAQIYPQIANIVDAYQMQSILNGDGEANWDKYISDLKAAGVEELVSVYQGAYDRYQAAME